MLEWPRALTFDEQLKRGKFTATMSWHPRDAEEIKTIRNVGSKSRVYTCHLHSPPPEGWTEHLRPPPAWPLDTPLLPPHIRNELAPCSKWTSRGTCCLFSHPSAASGTPITSCLKKKNWRIRWEFLSNIDLLQRENDRVRSSSQKFQAKWESHRVSLTVYEDLNLTAKTQASIKIMH